MMQRLFLIPDAVGKERFDTAKLWNAVQKLDGVMNWRSGNESVDPQGILFECELEPSDPKAVPIPIQVRRDLSSISIGAYDDVGLRSALEIQRLYGGNVFAFSEESSPEVVSLATINSPQELAERLRLR